MYDIPSHDRQRLKEYDHAVSKLLSQCGEPKFSSGVLRRIMQGVTRCNELAALSMRSTVADCKAQVDKLKVRFEEVTRRRHRTTVCE